MGPQSKPRPKSAPELANRPRLSVEDAEGADDELAVDGEAYLRWLETGEGDPWLDSSD